MRRSIALAAVLMLAALAAPPAPAATQIPVDAITSAELEADLLDDKEATLLFRLDGANFSQTAGPIRSAYVSLIHQGESPMELAMVPAGGQNWTAALPVSTPDLVKGTWLARFVAVRDTGSTILANRTLQLTASDSAAPQLALAKAASPVVVSSGESVDLKVSDPLLRNVTVEHAGLVPTPLAAPYSFATDSLPEGRTELTFRANDRAGHTNSLKVEVVRDTQSPQLNLTVPAHVYAGVPFQVHARVVEGGPYSLRLSINGTEQPPVQVAGSVAPGVSRSTSFTVTPEEVGNLTIGVQVADQVGFGATAGAHLPVEVPITDLRLSGLVPNPRGPLFAQRPVTFEATLEQAEGVTTLAVPVTLSVGGKSLSSVEQVPSTGPRQLTWSVQLPGGRHTATAVAEVPEGANETSPGDESDLEEVEVFLGRIPFEGKNYDIRAGANGLPSAAIEEGSVRTYPLEIVDSGKGVAYRFELSGNRTVDWDPLDPLSTKAARPTNTTTSSPTDDGKPAPGVAPVVALLMVALAALVQRRRLR